MKDEKDEVRERTKELAKSFAEKGDATGWFDALYKEAEGDNEKIPWADLVPNKFFVEFVEKTKLKGDNRKALVVGCGLGDDTRDAPRGVVRGGVCCLRQLIAGLRRRVGGLRLGLKD